MTYQNETDELRQGERSGHMPIVLGVSTFAGTLLLLAIAGFAIMSG